MLVKFKCLCAVLLILSLIGLTVCNIVDWDWKQFTLGLLFASINVVVFLL